MISRVLLIVSCLIGLAACLNDEVDNSTTLSSQLQEDELNNLNNKTHNKSDVVVDPIKARFLPFLVPLFIINRARGNNGTDSNDTTSATSNLTTEIPRIERAVNLTDLPGDLDNFTEDKQLNATDDLVNSTRNESTHHTRAMDVSLKTNFTESQNESSKADEDWDDLATLLSNVTDSEDEWDDDLETDQEELIENALLPLRLLARHSENSTLNDTSDFELDDDNNSSEPDNKPTGPHIFRMVIIDRIVPEVVNESSVLNSTSSNRTRRDVRYGAPPNPYAAQQQQPTYPPAYPAYPTGAATEPASYDAMAYYATPAAPSYPPAPAYAQPVIYATPVSPSYYTAPPAYTTTASYSYVVQQQPTYPSPASYKPSAYGPASYQQLDYAPASNDVPSYAAAPAPSYSAPNPPPAAYGPPSQQQQSYAEQPAGPATYPAPPARPAGLPTPPTTESPWF